MIPMNSSTSSAEDSATTNDFEYSELGPGWIATQYGCFASE